MREFVRATNSTEAFWALDPFADIRPNDPRFADIEKVLPREHFGVSEPLRRLFGEPTRRIGEVKVGLLGQQGTGKTTMARKAMDDLEQTGLMTVFIDALTAFDQGNFELPDVMLVIVRAVIELLAEQDIALDASITEATYRWFADELLTQEYKQQIEGSIGATASAGVAFPLLAKFAAKLTSALKTANEYRKEIRQRANRDVNDLIRRVNAVLDGAHAALAPSKRQICVVFDNLEKLVRREVVEQAILVTAQEIRELRTHIVFFLHPADNYAPKLIAASQAYPLIRVPSIPVRYLEDPAAIVRAEAIEAVRMLFAARVDLPGVFEDPDVALELLVRKSGGHTRDIFHIARRAIEFCEPEKVRAAHIEKAARALAGDRVPMLKAEDWPRVVAIHDSHAVENSESDGRLLLHSCVLFYDGEPWWDVHPVVLEHPRFEQTRSELARARARADAQRPE